MRINPDVPGNNQGKKAIQR